MSPETGVIVIGMHRSGTSATARLVNLLGVPIGDRTDLKPPNAVNVTGYWESNSLTAFNDRLLRFLGGSWAAPPLLGPGWERAPDLARHRAQALEVFRCVNSSRRWVWKDPRAAVTLPFWLEILPVRPVIVLPHRNPLEVARSLRARHGMRKEIALAIWERYSRSALLGARGLPVFVMPYEALLTDPLTWSHRLDAFLRLQGIVCSQATARAAAAFIDPGLRHHVVPINAVRSDGDVSSEQRHIVEAFESLAGEHDAFVGCPLPPESRQIEQLLSPWRRRDLRRWRDDVRRGPIDQRLAMAPVAAVAVALGS